METPKLELINNYHLAALINDIDNGDLRLPRFQRDYVWTRKKVTLLLDSIYREFPIGSFFVWHAHSRYRSLYKNIAELNLPDPIDDRQLRYILDGQQRATSLYVAVKGLKINGTDYSRICFDVENERFIEKTPDGTTYIAVRDIVDTARSVAISRTIADEHFATFQRCVRLLGQYPISIIGVKNMDLGDAIEIFERINRGGIRLGTFDLVVATTWSETFDLKIEYEKLRDDLKAEHFGTLPAEVVSQTASLILKNFCARPDQLAITSEELSKAWKEIDTAIRSAIDYLRTNMGVHSIEFMPYPSMLVLVAYAFYRSHGRSIDAKLEEALTEWFWKSALNERFSAALEARLGEDRREVVDKVMDGGKARIGSVALTKDRVRSVTVSTRSAIRNAFFCMLALKQPEDFRTGKPFPITNVMSPYGAVEKHHVFPKGYLRDKGIGNENVIANFCFIPGDLNREISDRAPSDYFKDFNRKNKRFAISLSTHLLAYDETIEKDDYVAFVERRSESILKEFEGLMGSPLLRDIEGNANTVIDNAELSLRKLIAHRCASDWENALPGKLKDKIKQRLADEEARTSMTNAHVTHLEELRQLDTSDYMSIIEKNWPLFAEDFGSQERTRGRLNAFRQFRNAVKHGRDMDDIVRNEGIAAIQWLNNLSTKATL